MQNKKKLKVIGNPPSDSKQRPGKSSVIVFPSSNKDHLSKVSEKKKYGMELFIAYKELAFQNKEREERAAELVIANKELIFQNIEKGNRAAELVIANEKLIIQNEEKEARAAELFLANTELAFQNEEKKKRAAELVIANKELVFQNEEKEKRALELIIANKELSYQNAEKQKRAEELHIANIELAFQNEEKEKRAMELITANKELEQFAFIASHDLQEPLRTVANYMQVFEEDYVAKLDDKALHYIHLVKNATKRMNALVKSLLSFSRLGFNKKLTYVDCNQLLKNVLADLDVMIKNSGAIIEVLDMPRLNAYEIELGQLFQNLITNAIKFHKTNAVPVIQIYTEKINENWQFYVKDTGIGIDPLYFERIFDIFQRLHKEEAYEGTGIGLANCKKIIQFHQGKIWVESTIAKGTVFMFTIPTLII